MPLTSAGVVVLGLVSYLQPELAALGLPIAPLLAVVRPLIKQLGAADSDA